MTLEPSSTAPIKSAVVSSCGAYRWALSRSWIPTLGTVMFVMLNPSTADAEMDDPTVRKCVGFARQWGRGAVLIGNLFAFRTKEPKLLRRAADPVGASNDEALAWMAAAADMIVVAWGSRAKHPELVDRARAVVEGPLADRPLLCLKLLPNGDPGHPLFAPYQTRPRSWMPEK